MRVNLLAGLWKTRIYANRVFRAAAITAVAALVILAFSFLYRQRESAKGLDTRKMIWAGLAMYRSGNFEKAYVLLDNGIRSADFNPADYRKINVRGIYDDCRRRLFSWRQPW